MMIFDALYESAQRGELLLIDGGMCRWHLRRDGQLTICEIIVTGEWQGRGRAMLELLKVVRGATSIFAKCPGHLPANGWYRHMGFELEGAEHTKTGKELKLWRLRLS